MNRQCNFILIVLLILVSAQIVQATDQELAVKLKHELEHEAKRLNDFKNQRLNKKTFEQEREKGLSLFLEEQEKWDITREKGLKEQRVSRLKSKEMDENSSEYRIDQNEKKRFQLELENSRKKQIATKQQVTQVFKNKINITEEEELGIYNDRPRYALRARGNNKWTAKGKIGSGFSSSPAGSSSSNGSFYNGSKTQFDYPPVPNQEYVPTDNFDDLPPPPPMMPYEGFGAPGMGGADPYFDNGGTYPPPMGYPPPPPDGGWDF
jgi:hypothetical protein